MKALKYTVPALVAAFVLVMFIGLMSDQPAGAPDQAVEAQSTSQEASVTSSSTITGLNPADVYLSLEDRGYTTSKEHSLEGMVWVSSSSDVSMSYTVTMGGKSATSVDLLKAAVVAMNGDSIGAGRHMLAFVASVTYSGAEPQRAKDWVLEHFDEDGATTTIGAAKLTIMAPSNLTRMLVMEPA